MNLFNQYYRYSKLSEELFRQVMECFALDFTATRAAATVGLSTRSVNAIFLRVRARLLNEPETASSRLRERDASQGHAPPSPMLGRIGKAVLLGIFGRDGLIRTEFLSEQVEVALRMLLLGAVRPEAVAAMPDGLDLDGVVDLQFERFFKIPGSLGSPEGCLRAEAAERFWNFARERLRKFKGLSERTLRLHLKECEFRFNHHGEDLYPLLLNLLKEQPL